MSAALSGRLSFLVLQMKINRMPFYSGKGLLLPFRPPPGLAVSEVVIQKGEAIELNLLGNTNVPHEGRHSPPHSVDQTLGEGSRVPVNVSFPDGDGDFVFYFSVVRK